VFHRLSDDRLDLSAVVHGYNRAFLAQTRRPGSLYCTCSCCTVVSE
jgi:hypothetical protein